MIRATLKSLCVVAVVGGVTAGGPWVAGRAMAQQSLARPATQPDAQAAGSTQPDAAGQPGGVGISFLLTRSLPEELNPQYVRIWRMTSPQAQKEMLNSMRSILRSTEGELQKIVEARKSFDRLSSEKQQEYRQRAQWIDQVLDRMSPSEKAVLMNLSPRERADKLRKLIAELKAQQARDAATGAPAKP